MGDILCVIAIIAALLSWSKNPALLGIAMLLTGFAGGIVISILLLTKGGMP